MSVPISKISSFNMSLLWFGTAVSIAEILTGTLLAPLGIVQGICAVVLGHFIGGAVLFIAGFIGADRNCSSAESVNLFFGRFGSTVFSLLNIVQLIGWITIMLIIGSEAVNRITDGLWQLPPHTFIWTSILGLMPCIWIFFKGGCIDKINRLIMACLFMASLWLAFNSLFGENISSAISPQDSNMNFGLAVELSVVMCLSWMPVISDYTHRAQNKIKGTFCAAAAYCFGSSLMYIIGLGSAVHFQTNDICDIFALSGLGVIALIVILLSTITTNFVAINSASLCFNHLVNRASVKITFILICFLSIVMAYFISMQQYENFLYFIGAIFAPLFAVLFSEFFLLRNTFGKINMDKIVIKNCLLWLIGFIIYEYLIDYTTFIGITFPVMLGIAICNFIVSQLLSQKLICVKKF
ncbi:putative hydroxymethylpyrimidine transporter CytX [Megamonas hypermegale]|uniref:putative hydroxymethylpyrimidine transporter CytX n=1 Tax=Megamonas hypermegale TaxID=158847 RepID=UPI0026EC703E|nr:putative hydroxymethylpyrimidine transporter CytX [Megamonas hypermegale]